VTASTSFTIEFGAGGLWGGLLGNLYTAENKGIWTVTGNLTARDMSDNATLAVLLPDHMEISPQTANVTAGDSVAYTATAFDTTANLSGDATGVTQFSIEPGAGGFWGGLLGNQYTAEKPGTWIVDGDINLPAILTLPAIVLSDNATLTVNLGPPDHIVVSPDSANVTSGDNVTYTAEVFDQAHNSLGDVTANTTFSIEPAALGGWTDNLYISEKAGNWTVTGNCSGMADNATLTVNPGLPDHIVVSPDNASVTSGDNVTYTAEAFDPAHNSLGDVTTNTTFTIETGAGGFWSQSVYISELSGNWTVTGNYSGMTDNATLTVNPGPPDHIVVSPDNASVTAGDNQTYTAEAFDQASNSLGDVTANTSFSIEPAAGGNWTQNIYTSESAGNWTVTGNYSGMADNATLNVNPGPAASLDMIPNGGTTIIGFPMNATVTLYDSHGNVATGYNGTVNFTSTDPVATLPPDHTFTPADAGAHTFPSSIALFTSGNQAVNVTDTADSSISSFHLIQPPSPPAKT
jgi:plastocyanin